MRKLLVLTLTALTITALVGCGGKNEKIDNKEVLTNSNNVAIQSESKMLLAKVKKVVGNEISVKLSDEKFEMPEGGDENGAVSSYTLDEGQLKQLEDEGTITLGDGTVVGTVTIDPNAEDPTNPSGSQGAIPAEGLPGTEGGEDSQNNVEIFGSDSTDGDMFSGIEFNGEDKDLVIPAGVEIFNMKSGKTGNVSDIKEGSILSIVIDGKTNTVTRIDIMG